MKISIKQLKAMISEAVEQRLQENADMPSSRYPAFVETMIGHISRSQSEETKAFVAETYDKILKVLRFVELDKMSLKQVEEKYPNFFNSIDRDSYRRFQLKRAMQELSAGKLSVKDMPKRGKDLVEINNQRKEENRARLQSFNDKQAAEFSKLSPEEQQKRKAEAELQAVYGGDRNKRPWGLGT